MKEAMAASFTVVMLAALAYGAERDPRFVTKLQIPDSAEVLVVAEGDLEPRSIGSYALRLYGGSSKEFSTDHFIAGLVWPRNGAVEAVRFADINGDGRAEIVVIVRSAGSGGYVSADAFGYRAGAIEFVISVSDLDKAADPIEALRTKLKLSTKRNSAVKANRHEPSG
jgi:hypothetical protein